MQMRIVRWCLGLCFSLLLTATLLEAGLRLIGLGPPVSLNIYDADLGWSKKRDVTLTRGTFEGFDVTFRFNEHGLRNDADVVPQKPAGTFRLLALGDSFTLGTMVDRQDLFLDRLEKRWQDEGRSVQVINAGAEAYSTDQEVRWLEVHGRLWQPDLILLFPYENDVYWNGQTQYTGLHKPRYEVDGAIEERILVDTISRGWFQDSAIGRLLAGPPGTGVPAFQPGSRAIKREHAVLLDYAPEWLDEPVARTGGALTALRRSADALGAKVVVVPIPAHSAIDPDYRAIHEANLGLAGIAWSADRPVDLFLALAAASRLPTLDVRSTFRALREQSGPLYFQKDWHINARGNKVLADYLYEELDRLELGPTRP